MLPFLIVASILVYVSVIGSDLFYRTIPDFLPVSIVAIAILRWTISLQISDALWTIGTAALVFAAGALFFARGWFGGGDVKLVSATALLVGFEDTLPFLLWMALAGGVLSVLVLVWDFAHRRRVRPDAGADPAMDADGAIGRPVSVPYGVAIAVSAILILFPQLDQH